ncbi:MAG: o-succinylbenzoate synthase [Acidimicrobiia bacterium]
MSGESVELLHIALPLLAPFRTAAGTHHTVEKLLVRVVTATAEGWGECPVGLGPGSVDSVGEARDALRTGDATAPPPATGALETARLDAELRTAGTSLASRLGATKTTVDAGVAIGIAPSVPALLDEVERRLGEGYRRVKLKIGPGWDVEPVTAVRDRFGGEVALQVDANGAYTLDDADHLANLDRFGLLMLEQPLPAEDLEGHAELARRVRTPVCLDESITSEAQLDRALTLGACSIVNVKPARLGGLLTAKRIHDRCVNAGVPVWCGGMLETGIGRSANLALAALPGFTLPADLSASDRYFERDLTPPFVLDDGQLAVPDGPGIGVDPLPDVLDAVTVSREDVT